jgi:hypothetical protein
MSSITPALPAGIAGSVTHAAFELVPIEPSSVKVLDGAAEAVNSWWVFETAAIVVPLVPTIYVSAAAADETPGTMSAAAAMPIATHAPVGMDRFTRTRLVARPERPRSHGILTRASVHHGPRLTYDWKLAGAPLG